MKSKLLLFVIALAGVTLGYLAGGNNRENDAAAQSKPITTAYHIVYLSDPSVEHGKWTLEMAQAYGFQLLESWTEVRKVAEVHPLDALVAAQSKFAELTETDRTWLRSQIEEGLIIAGIGIDIEPFSAALGLPNLRNPGEARSCRRRRIYPVLCTFAGNPSRYAAHARSQLVGAFHPRRAGKT